METLFCQSCGMPLETQEVMGTEANGEKNTDYCCYCYAGGTFTRDCTMEEMILHCARFTEEFNKGSEIKYTREEAIANMRQFFPHLKRWKDPDAGQPR